MASTIPHPSSSPSSSRSIGAADLILAAVVAAALLPGSLLPVIVSAVHGVLGFPVARAAMLGTVDMAGVAAGSLLVAFVGQPRRSGRALALLLGLSSLIDIASVAALHWPALLALRAGRGVVGGLIVGVGYGAIGRRPQPERVFGQVLLLQFLLGGAGVILLPPLLRAHGVAVLFMILAAVGAALAMACTMARPAGVDHGHADPVPGRVRLPNGKQVAVLAALFLAEAGHTAGSAFVLEWGRQAGHGVAFTEQAAGIAGMMGMVGAMAAIAIGIRWGRLRPILIATGASLAACAGILAPSRALFAAGLVTGSIAWAWSIPYMLGWCTAEGDERSGGAWAGFAAKVGLATGPMIGAAAIAHAGIIGPFVAAAGLAAASGGIFWSAHSGREVPGPVD